MPNSTNELPDDLDTVGWLAQEGQMIECQTSEENLPEGYWSLMESEERFRLLVESVTDYAIYMLDPSGRILTWNIGAERSKGYRSEEVLGKNYSMFFPPEAQQAHVPQLELFEAASAGSIQTEGWRVRKGGSEFWALVTLTAIRSAEGKLRGFAKVTRDMSAAKILEEAQARLAAELERRVADRTAELDATVNQLRAKNKEVEGLAAMASNDLREKEVLLREVYHRVKNNLQMVQSLLKMGARTLVSEDSRLAFDTAIQRVHVMAMVHEHLYQMPNLAGLALSAFLREVVEGAVACNSERPDQIQLELDVDNLAVPLDLAIPLGLLTNELVSNCLKHGIPHGQPGRILVLARSTNGAMRFAVQDNGPGLPEEFDPEHCKSMGLKLAASLAKQLGGRLEFTSSHGCRVEARLSRIHNDPPAPDAIVQPASPLPGNKQTCTP